MAPHTVETEIGSEGLVKVRIPDALEGRKVRVTVEEIDAAGHRQPALRDVKAAERDVRLDELRKLYEAREITQKEYSVALVSLLEQYDEEDPKAPSKRRVFGGLKGKIHIMPGFDDPIEGLEWAYE